MDQVREALLEIRPSKFAPRDLVFNKVNFRADRLAKDLKRIGIPSQDDRGRYADFHALRMCFNTFLQHQGLPPAIIKRMMRVTEEGLINDVYLDAGHLPIRQYVTSLPDLALESKGAPIGAHQAVAISPSVSGSVASNTETSRLQAV